MAIFSGLSSPIICEAHTCHMACPYFSLDTWRTCLGHVFLLPGHILRYIWGSLSRKLWHGTLFYQCYDLLFWWMIYLLFKFSSFLCWVVFVFIILDCLWILIHIHNKSKVYKKHFFPYPCCVCILIFLKTIVSLFVSVSVWISIHVSVLLSLTCL